MGGGKSIGRVESDVPWRLPPLSPEGFIRGVQGRSRYTELIRGLGGKEGLKRVNGRRVRASCAVGVQLVGRNEDLYASKKQAKIDVGMYISNTGLVGGINEAKCNKTK